MKKVVLFLLYLCFAVASKSQTVVIAPQYEGVRGFSESYAAVEQNGKWGYVDVKGKIVIPPIYVEARDFHEGKAAVKTEKGWGYINADNMMVIPDKFFDARDFSEGLAAVKSSIETNKSNDDGYEGEYWGHNNELESWRYIKEDGTLAFGGFFRDVSTFHDGVACVYNEKYWYYINKEGKAVYRTKYDNYYPVHYSDGLIPNVGGELGDEWGYSDLSGKWIVKPQYRSVTEFCDGIAVVEEFGGKMKVIDNKGNVLYNGVNDRLFVLKGGFILDGNGLYYKDNFSIPYATLDVPDSYWQLTDVITIPSTQPSVASPTVSFKPPLNIQSVELLHSLKALSYKQPGNGLWATEFDNGYCGYTALNMQDYIRQYVLFQMKDWLKKGEYESSSAYQKRTSEEQRHRQMAMYASELINNLLKKQYDKWTLSNYDADHETFALTTDIGQYVIKVPQSSAKAFKDGWAQTRKEVAFAYHDGLSLESITFYPPSGNDFTHPINNSLVYDGRDVTVDLSGNSLAINIVEGNGNGGKEDTKKTAKPRKSSDVDLNIPATAASNQNTFAVIIGNEQYEKVAQVAYANNDARTFAGYCKKTLGLPEKNVKLYENATFGAMIGAVSDIQKIAKAFKGDINVIFYYAGHGIPDEATGDGYLLPIDADGLKMEVCYPLARLYRELSELQAHNVTVFLDACFSGAQRGNGMVVAARGVAMKAKTGSPKGNVVVFSAATDKQTAFPYEEKGHGMFTYYILKKLRDTKGDCTLGELGKYICSEVAKQAVVTNGKEQTPVVHASSEIAGNWETIKLK